MSAATTTTAPAQSGGAKSATSLQQTALHDCHLALNARMMEFGGWQMPLQYSGILAEHQAVRGSCGLFDTSHMATFTVSGAAALDTLESLVTQELASLAVGGCRYGFMLNRDGGVRDDLIIYRLAATEWLLVVNAGTAESDWQWLNANNSDSSMELCDLRIKRGKLDLQGPQALERARAVLRLDLEPLRRFRWGTYEMLGESWIISRTGYTGEDGFEFYGSSAGCRKLWQLLIEAGVTPCGLGARDTLRLEAGYCLYGHELDLEHSPAEAGLMRYCLKGCDFIGREALMSRAAAPSSALVPFILEGRQSARHRQSVLGSDGASLGYVTSGSFAPTLGRAIGFAYVTPGAATPGMPLLIDTGRARLPGSVTELPFLKR